MAYNVDTGKVQIISDGNKKDNGQGGLQDLLAYLGSFLFYQPLSLVEIATDDGCALDWPLL